MKQKTLADAASQIHVIEADLQQGQSLENSFDIPEGADRAVILVEDLSGSTQLEISGSAPEELSRYQRVKIRLRQLAQDTESLTVQVTAKVTASVRLCIAFVRKRLKTTVSKMPCKLCKELCRLAVSALLAHFGIPYLDAEETQLMDGVQLPEQYPGGSLPTEPIDLDKLGVDDSWQIEVQTGDPVPINADCQRFLEDPASGPDWLRDLFERIDPTAIAAVRATLKGLAWLFDVSDKIYTQICTVLELCEAKPEAG